MIGSVPDRYARLVVSAARTTVDPEPAVSTRSGAGPSAARRRALVATMMSLLLAVGLGWMADSAGPASAAAPAPRAQVPGDDELELPAEEGPEGDLPVVSTTTVTEATPTPAGEDPAVDDSEGSDGSVDAENRRILLIILGLVAVAIALTLLTIRYWRQTRPMPLPVDEAEHGPIDRDLDGEGDGSAATGEVVGIDEVDAGDDPRADDDDPYADIFEPVVESPRRSRRAVAGADHADVDELWIPRGTGEHGRIEVADTSTIAKPNADQRSAAFEARREG